MTLFSLRFPVCYMFVCVVILTLFHVCAWKESGCDKNVFVVWVKCWDDVWCQKYLSQVRFPFAMKPRNAVMSSVVCWCDLKMWLFRLSPKWRRTLKWIFDLCRVKLWSLLLRCVEWSIPTSVCLGTSWMARTVKWRLSLGGIFVDLRVCVPELRYGSTD